MKEVTIVEAGMNEMFPYKTLTTLMTDEEYNKLDEMQDRGNWSCIITYKDAKVLTAKEVEDAFEPKNYKFNGL